MFQYNIHSAQRAAQRNIFDDDITYVVQHGVCYHRAGAVIYFLRQLDIPRQDQILDACMRLVGTAVVLSKDEQTLITVWRNRRKGLKNIRQKPLYSWSTNNPIQ